MPFDAFEMAGVPTDCLMIQCLSPGEINQCLALYGVVYRADIFVFFFLFFKDSM